MRMINGAAAAALTLALGAFGFTAFAQGDSNNGSSGSVNATPQSTPIDNGSGTLNQSGTTKDNSGIENQSGRDTSMATSNPCSQFNGIQNQSGTDTTTGSSTSSTSATSGQNFQAYTVDKVTAHKVVLRPFNAGASSSSNVQLQSGREVTIPLHKFQTLVNANGSLSGGGSMSGTSSTTGSTDYDKTGNGTTSGTSTDTSTGSSSTYGKTGTSTTSSSTSASAAIKPQVGDTVCVAMGTSNQPKAIQLLNGSSKLNDDTQKQSGHDIDDQGTMNNGATPAPVPSPATGTNPSGSTP